MSSLFTTVFRFGRKSPEMMEHREFLNLLDRVNREKTKLVCRYFQENGANPILLKGWSLARFYPDNAARPYADIDIAFDPADRLAMLELSSRLAIPGTAVDIHFGLKGLDLLTFSSLAELSYEVEVDGLAVRVLGDEDNLRVTSVHWLTDGGVNKERLWDIFYLVNNRKTDFDWERCLESNGPVRKTWIMAAIATARDHLDLDVSGLPEEAQRFQLPAWYEKTLEVEWKRGPYIRRVMSTVVMKPKLLIEQLHRRFPPNRIAATIDTETPIDNSSRIPAQAKSLKKKVMPFARGLTRRITYKRQKHDR